MTQIQVSFRSHQEAATVNSHIRIIKRPGQIVVYVYLSGAFDGVPESRPTGRMI